MKAIVGVDVAARYKPAIQLLARFRFSRPETVLAHYMNPLPDYAPLEMVNGAEFQQDYLHAIENIGRAALDQAQDEACMRDLNPKCRLQLGSPSGGLIDLAAEMQADLVAVRAERGSLWATSFLGSVSRALATGCETSILIAKESVKEGLPLKVVLATDHSEESNRWFSKFLSWSAKGISEVHVVTAYEIDDHEARILRANLPALGGMVDTWIEEHLEGLNSRLVARLKEAGYTASSRVGAGTANDVIRQAMQDTQADVLVMGARGHGFVTRLLIGSCAMHQVTAEPYPVLVVRP